MSVNGFTFDDGVTFQKYNYESLDNIPDIENGTYPNMAVGSLLGTNKVTDTEPYKLRASKSIGDRAFDTLVGGTLGWNQLVNPSSLPSTTTQNGVTFTNNGDGSITVNGTATADARLDGILPLNTWQAHKYLLIGCPSGGDVSSYVLALRGQGADVFDTGSGVIWDASSASYKGVCIYIKSGVTANNLKFKPQFIDLTTLFGATIADYIYSLEQATAGAGVAWVRKYLPDDYYAYCSPTLKHVSGVSAHVMRDANNNVIGNYAIDSTWVGMGIPKLDSDGKLYFDGDRYASDGTVTEKYGIVDLGTLDYSPETSGAYGRYYTTGLANLIKKQEGSLNIACSMFVTTATLQTVVDNYGYMWLSGTGNVSFSKNGYADHTAFKTAMSGVYLVYELATPTTSSASPFTSPQICDKDGTEEYVTTGLVPVGHNTQYPENLAEKISSLPSLPTEAGTYRLKVTVTAGKASYEWVSA